ncbi:MAG: hypothetical protein JXX28_07155 [Deltaproteobacteria bacterium]|nr:hypothetical protein [Deltaproteobacteria bacterium]
MRHPRWLLLALLLAGCEPTCETVCTDVLACDLDSDRVSHEECETSCVRQQQLYEDWEDDAKRELFAEHKTCLHQASCEEIAAGQCYDETLFLF